MEEQKNIIIIIDESGSMRTLGDEPIQSINSFIKDQQKLLSNTSNLSLYKFNDKVTKLIDKQNLNSFKEFTEFEPEGMTALYDAIGHSINDNKHSKDVSCIIVTDGMDNMSQSFDKKTIKKLINKITLEQNWNFTYLGANQDAFKEGSGIGIKTCHTFSPSPSHMTTPTLTSIMRKVSSDISLKRSESKISYCENLDKIKKKIVF